MSVAITACDGGVRLPVRVSPGASRDRIVGAHGDALKVAVAAPPERGAANARLCELLAAALGVPRRSVSVVAGAASRDKVVQVLGLDVEAVRARLHIP